VKCGKLKRKGSMNFVVVLGGRKMVGGMKKTGRSLKGWVGGGDRVET
jgi:hypothetical protein